MLKIKNSACTGGTCHGFSSVLSVLRDNDSLKTYFSQLSSIGEIKEDTAYSDIDFKRLIQIMQYTQHTTELSKQKKNNKNKLSNLVTTLNSELSSNSDMIQLVIGIHNWDKDKHKYKGHALTPYAIEETPADSNVYSIYVYDSNFPFEKNYITIDLNNNTWSYQFNRGDVWNSSNGYIEYTGGIFSEYMNCIKSEGDKLINSDSNGIVYSSLIIPNTSISIENSSGSIVANGENILGDTDNIEIYPVVSCNESSDSEYDDEMFYYINPSEYKITNLNSQPYDIVYCLTDTDITAGLAKDAEITLNVSDDDINNTYATVTGKSGDNISLTYEHDTLIDRDFTSISFDGIMYDTLETKETANGISVKGLKSGTFTIIADDGTITTKTVENIPENAEASVVVYTDNTGDVLFNDNENSNDASLSKIFVDGIEISDFSKNILDYTLMLPCEADNIPIISALAENTNASVSISQAASLTGTVAERTATITVTAEDGVTQKVYRVIFEKITDVHTHSYSETYCYNETDHWHECACGDKINTASHVSDGGEVTLQPTATTEGIKTYSCSVCGYVIKTETISTTNQNTQPNYTDNQSSSDNNTSYVNIIPTYSFERIKLTGKISKNSVTLSWTDISDADKYTIYQLVDGKYKKVKTTTENTITLKNLPTGKYKFKVKYTVGRKTSPLSKCNSLNVNIKNRKPYPIATVKNNAVTLKWQSVDNAEKYAVYIICNGKATKLKETQKTSVKYKLKSEKEYSFAVRAYVDGKWTAIKTSDIIKVTAD